MIRANCRARFTAADFDFIVRTLARSRGDSVSLVDLLSDSETRDSILDHPRLLETFSRANQLQTPDKIDNPEMIGAGEGFRSRAHEYISDMLIALTSATPEQKFLLRAHVGNYSLFISGIFHENTHRRSLRGAPDIEFYEQVGRTNYQLVASHETARRCELSDVFAGLADRFHDVRLALNELSDRLLHLDEEARPSLVL